MKKILFLALATLATLQAAAQWRIGANVGGMYNHYVIDKHYFDDYQYKDRWSVGFGLMGQYDIFDWLVYVPNSTMFRRTTRCSVHYCQLTIASPTHTCSCQ